LFSSLLVYCEKNDMVIAASILSVVAVSAGVLWKRHRSLSARRVFRCPGCSQQIRFKVRQIGAKGRCPRCLEPISPPSNPRAAVRSAHRLRPARTWFSRVGSVSSR
jgi:hypothetical protein